MTGGCSAPGLRAYAQLACAALALAVLPGAPAAAGPLPIDAAREAAVARALETVRQRPADLRIFLRAMPKGGDLHNHLAGAIYAEDLLRWAGAKGFCVAPDGQGVEPPPCPADRAIPRVAARDEFGFDRLIDALSTRGWQRGVGADEASGHAQFFSTFERFGPLIAGAGADMLATARTTAAADNLSYLELGHNPSSLSATVVAAGDAPLDEAGLAARFAAEQPVLVPEVARARAEIDAQEAAVGRSLGCATAAPAPGCAVTVRYLFQGLRTLPPAQAYRSLILGFMLAAADPRFVGVNIVAPEDSVVARRDYRLHMAMLRYLAGRFPQVRMTLHAGELALGQVPPADLRDHVALAVAAGARRIGHGTDIALEDAAEATLAHMARERIAVEISLSSSAVILGLKGAEHPMALYRAHGVPVVLSTDDAGVLRTDMTNEYVRAVREQGLGYRDLKAIARDGLEYAFVPGASLWADATRAQVVSACADLAAQACTRFLAQSTKARLQAELEQRFARFEAERLAVAAGPAQAMATGIADRPKDNRKPARNAYSMLQRNMMPWVKQG